MAEVMARPIFCVEVIYPVTLQQRAVIAVERSEAASPVWVRTGGGEALTLSPTSRDDACIAVVDQHTRVEIGGPAPAEESALVALVASIGARKLEARAAAADLDIGFGNHRAA